MRIDHVALGVGVLALMTAGLVYNRSIRPPAPSSPLAVVVLGDVDGGCQVMAKDNPIKASRSANVVWVVMNTCATDQAFGVGEFLDGEPFIPGNTERAVPAGTQRVLALKVKQDAPVQTYRYAIFLNKVRQMDPEIIIEY